MAIYDTDKTSDNRSKPTPNTNDKVISPMAFQTVTTTYTPIGEISDFSRVQMENKRILSYDDSNVKSIILGKLDDGTQGLEIAREGYDISTATDEQKVMSSKFNMYKIIASGDIQLTPRNANITLSGTTIGYSFMTRVDNILALGGISGHLLLNVYGFIDSFTVHKQMDIKGSGNFYDDGTNKAIFDYHYFMQDAELFIVFNVRLTAGSLTFNPTTVFGGLVHWEICNQTNSPASGGGVVYPGDGKYYYFDLSSCDSSSSTPYNLSSSLKEFTGGESNHFPKPLVTNIPGYNRW